VDVFHHHKRSTNTSVDYLMFCERQWRLVTVICGRTATAPNKYFVKTKKHHVFHGGADCYYAEWWRIRFKDEYWWE